MVYILPLFYNEIVSHLAALSHHYYGYRALLNLVPMMSDSKDDRDLEGDHALADSKKQENKGENERIQSLRKAMKVQEICMEINFKINKLRFNWQIKKDFKFKNKN
jgi:hypothetical protein